MRSVRRLALALAILVAGLSAGSAEMTITDVAGREVRIAAPARRILLEGPAYYPALSLLSRNAADLVVGVGATEGRGQFEAERDLAGKPRLGLMTSHTFSVEKALDLKPDLLIATLDRPGQNAAVEAAFATAGVPILYVDFFIDPARNTVPSLEIIGRAIGEDANAAAYVDFHRSRVDKITQRIETAKPSNPKLLVFRRSWDGTCCWSFAKGFISSYFEPLNVTNIAEDKLPGVVGQLSLEGVIAENPELFVATDMSLGPDSLFGPQRTREQSLATLKRLIAEPGLNGLAAIEQKRVHAIDITLLRSPLNVLAVELPAKWAHPELFADIDPKGTLDEMNRRFLARPLDGVLWVDLQDSTVDRSGSRP